MNIEKKLVTHLTKCYCLAPLCYRDKLHYLVASEKNYSCLLVDTHGNVEEEIWSEPGGTMSMVWIPGTDGKFLATHRMYSPNDSKQASIVLVEPPEHPGPWKVTTLAELPHVHRFDLLTRNGVQYLLACTLCSGRDYKDDWTHPGKVYAAALSPDFPQSVQSPLALTVLKDNLTQNHGYCRVKLENTEAGLVTADSGVYLFIPPESPQGQWTIRQLLDKPISDALLVDLDHDGLPELVTLEPFHGDFVSVYHDSPNGYQQVYALDRPFQFGHAICCAQLNGLDCAVLGARKGERDLLALYHKGPEPGDYAYTVIDHDVGAANVLYDRVDGKDILLSANREIDEVAYYIIH